MSNTGIHLLPFGIDREGPINTKEYFSVEKNNDQLETIMLGRKLIGTPVQLTNNTIGNVWEKKLSDDDINNEDDETEEKSTWIKSDKTIEEFILWKKDAAPNPQDPRINSLHSWLDISQTVNTKIKVI
ncbi:hypothetical protein INT47_002622 [Mucor saturninus]|uniref:Uncharacterized protein n=1 Tax=Mucor saturninus TaxID=64648 RepID=A0A8H7V6C3_9FUNG|nr:hypothetical protein INT47_002622 [Mucor saturninus]